MDRWMDRPSYRDARSHLKIQHIWVGKVGKLARCTSRYLFYHVWDLLAFLDVTSHLYRRVCPSVRQSAHWSDRLLLNKASWPTMRPRVWSLFTQLFACCLVKKSLLSVSYWLEWRFMKKCVIFCYFDESVTDRQTDRPTHGRTDRSSCNDARSHLKN